MIKVCSFPWQSKGHRFDSDILHIDYQFVADRSLIELKSSNAFSLLLLIHEDY